MTAASSSDSSLTPTEQGLVQRALAAARDTKFLSIAGGVRHRTADYFRNAFGAASAVVVADRATFQAAGADVLASLQRAGVHCETPFLFPDDVYAESAYVEMLEMRLQGGPDMPIAVGAGTINDLCKLAAFRQGRQYLSVGTAASMDGYTAYGASITHRGSKQTFDCPAPLAVLADLEVIGSAPAAMNAAGYADLIAKGAAGADWILANALGEEPVHAASWALVQDLLPEWVASPQGIPAADPVSLRRLVVGLIMSGFAMQSARSSRPASGAEHQFSHLWDMQQHTHQGFAPSHGFKVGVGTCASLNLYRFLMQQDFNCIDIDTAVADWPTRDQVEHRIVETLGAGEVGEKALIETGAKYRGASAIREQLITLKKIWPELRERLEQQLRPFQQIRSMLAAAGAPSEPEQIGISRERLLLSFEQAFYLRRRFTVLDLAMRTQLFKPAMESLFGVGGDWEIQPEPTT